MWNGINKQRWFAMALGLTLASVGCGDDDGDSTADAGTGGTAGSIAGAGGGNVAGTGGGSAGTGGNAAGAGGGGFEIPNNECDADVPTTATCGGVECPAPTSPTAAFTCTVPCCVADQCGTRSAGSLLNTQCALPAEVDSNCPDFEGTAGGMPVSLPGCCTTHNVCGVISSISNSCITESMFLDLPENPPACGSNATADAGVGDAG